MECYMRVTYTTKREGRQTERKTETEREKENTKSYKHKDVTCLLAREEHQVQDSRLTTSSITEQHTVVAYQQTDIQGSQVGGKRLCFSNSKLACYLLCPGHHWHH